MLSDAPPSFEVLITEDGGEVRGWLNIPREKEIFQWVGGNSKDFLLLLLA